MRQILQTLSAAHRDEAEWKRFVFQRMRVRERVRVRVRVRISEDDAKG